MVFCDQGEYGLLILINLGPKLYCTQIMLFPQTGPENLYVPTYSLGLYEQKEVIVKVIFIQLYKFVALFRNCIFVFVKRVQNI